MKDWVKLNLFFLGESKKKHLIFRAKYWSRNGKNNLERIFKKSVFNEKYEKIGYIKDIFGPLNLPFISIKTFPGQEFNPNNNLYARM